MKRFLAQGGLGNQLFVLSEAINTKTSTGHKIRISLPDRSKNSISELGKMKDITISCSKGDHKIYQLASFLSYKFPTSLATGLLGGKVAIAKTVTSRLEAQAVREGFWIIGFFQDYNVVEQSWNQIKVLLEDKFIELEPRISQITNMKKYSVMHVRRGDYLQNRNSYGLLSLSYYDKLRAKLNYPTFILTDDETYLYDLKANFKDAEVLGPNHLNTWESLAFMARASQIVTANSSLSWWASYFVTKHGGIAYLPRPWFKQKDKPGVSPLLFFPGAREVQSEFE